MSNNELPRPNNQALSWFYGEHASERLILRPDYQRNPIWSLGQKCFLIDSILAGYPLPQIYLNVTTNKKGGGRVTQYEVVDGQQRLTSILEFMADEWKLISTTAKAYPVSEIYREHIGKSYSELPSHLQDRIWNYPLVVQELRNWDQQRIHDLFRRLNYVVERLNKQELRHSQYFGEFADTVERLASALEWDEFGIFNRRDSTRMKDVEFVAELLILTMDGVQDQQKSIDSFYAEYDVRFPKKAKIVKEFEQILDSLETIAEFISESRFKKKADFYALFAVTKVLVESNGQAKDLSGHLKGLQKFDEALQRDPKELRGQHLQYYQTVVEGPNKLAKRRKRIEIVSQLFEV